MTYKNTLDCTGTNGPLGNHDFNPRDMAQLDMMMEYMEESVASGPFFYATVVNAVPALIEEVKRLNDVVELQGQAIKNSVRIAQENESFRGALCRISSLDGICTKSKMIAREALKAEGV